MKLYKVRRGKTRPEGLMRSSWTKSSRRELSSNCPICQQGTATFTILRSEEADDRKTERPLIIFFFFYFFFFLHYTTMRLHHAIYSTYDACLLCFSSDTGQ